MDGNSHLSGTVAPNMRASPKSIIGRNRYKKGFNLANTWHKLSDDQANCRSQPQRGRTSLQRDSHCSCQQNILKMTATNRIILKTNRDNDDNDGEVNLQTVVDLGGVMVWVG